MNPHLNVQTRRILVPRRVLAVALLTVLLLASFLIARRPLAFAQGTGAHPREPRAVAAIGEDFGLGGIQLGRSSVADVAVFVGNSGLVRKADPLTYVLYLCDPTSTGGDSCSPRIVGAIAVEFTFAGGKLGRVAVSPDAQLGKGLYTADIVRRRYGGVPSLTGIVRKNQLRDKRFEDVLAGQAYEEFAVERDVLVRQYFSGAKSGSPLIHIVEWYWRPVLAAVDILKRK